ncbi:uracil-DNA glycosylase family protein [Alteromonas aestuariivivens]|uniref:Uracil-DNA glycosylase family protein n=1 Tax=Alteromonas aestuariivivens TaxID=1938339 RepID=A0A3D8M2T2_9ALTE|nr:uracil-DNA glycosylase family protein [Alteromonas aestuariivivens]RDV24023.1 uracil-DNA glycosylase family protein [Alteromonas aestuariivivens]
MTVTKKSKKSLSDFQQLLQEVQRCALCQQHLPFTANPVISVGQTAKIIIIGQAPGIKAHQTSTPWNDASGHRLREWLGIGNEIFYNPDLVALMPMGFCFPGYIKGADAPPRRECAPQWHSKLLAHLSPELTLLIGRYAQNYYLPQYNNLTDAVRHQGEEFIGPFVLPHPSGRNNRWLKINPWFEEAILPGIRKKLQASLKNQDTF